MVKYVCYTIKYSQQLKQLENEVAILSNLQLPSLHAVIYLAYSSVGVRTYTCRQRRGKEILIVQKMPNKCKYKYDQINFLLPKPLGRRMSHGQQ